MNKIYVLTIGLFLGTWHQTHTHHGENQSESVPLSFDVIIPLSHMHKTINACMQAHELLISSFHTVPTEAISYEHSFCKQLSHIQDAMEDLILNNTRYLHTEDLIYLSNLIDRIEGGYRHVYDQNVTIDLLLHDIKSTVQQLIAA